MSTSLKPTNNSPQVYGVENSVEAADVSTKECLLESNDNITTDIVPFLQETWTHLGAPLSRANDVIFLPNDGSAIVADWYAGQVHRFSDMGQHTASKLVKYSPWNFLKERSRGPWSIAYSCSDDKIYVSEIGVSSLCRLSTKNLERDRERIKLEGVKNPAGLAFLRNGQLVLTEHSFQGSHRAAIYDLSGKMIKDWECPDPQLVCVDDHDRIIVSDHSGNRVVVYDTSGLLLTSFGDAKTLRQPTGVATGKHGNIYVTHEVPYGCALSLWSAEGRRVAALQEWNLQEMSPTDSDNWHMRSVDVHGDRLVLLGRQTLHWYALKGP